MPSKSERSKRKQSRQQNYRARRDVAGDATGKRPAKASQVNESKAASKTTEHAAMEQATNPANAKASEANESNAAKASGANESKAASKTTEHAAM